MTGSVLSLRGEEVEETEIAGLATDRQTFFCGNIPGKKIVQVMVSFTSAKILKCMCDVIILLPIDHFPVRTSNQSRDIGLDLVT